MNLTITTVGRDYFDNAGNFLGEALHFDIIGTDTANGITLNESDHYQDVFAPSGAVKEVGVPIHIQGVHGGLVIRDAGFLLFNPDGSIAVMHGPHPQLTGDTASLCAAFG